MIKELLKLANHLDAKGLSKEADYLDAVIRKIATGNDDVGEPIWDIHTAIGELAETVIEKEEESNKRMFNHYDSDGSGAIDPNEGDDLFEGVRTALRMLNPEASDLEIESAIENIMIEEYIKKEYEGKDD